MSNNQRQLRVAIIGASGIGKNHAAWFQKNDANVCAFAGSSHNSVARTQEVLESRLGYAPHGYTSLEQLLSREAPDAVCIASPPECHFEQVQLCFQNKIATLCEKPLVYDSRLDHATLIRQAQQLTHVAREQNTLLGTQMQYSLIGSKLCELAGTSPDAIESFEMEMETKNLKPGRSHETVWIELAPHPLSVLQRIAGDATLAARSIKCTVGAMETTAEFEIDRSNGGEIRSRIVVRCNPDTSTPIRRFTLNGVAIDYAGRKNEAGEFLTYLSTGETEIEMPDLVDLLIRNFVAACHGREELKVTGSDGARNVEWMLRILDGSWRI